MDTHRSRRVAGIFDQAIELGPEERAALLDRACGGDAELRAEVEELLSFHDPDEPDDLLPLPPPEALAGGPAADGQRIGPYRILRLIAEGGMGTVYLAEREDIGLRVALKLLHSGRLATLAQVERFLRERRVLARLEHPSIARLLDAGATDEGLPFLVMEYVEGEPITAFCDRRRLSVEDRLWLFLEVCGATQYAHGRLIVHRDIKPSNILVTTQGAAKLLDFGIAKLLGDPDASDDPLTRSGSSPLTPEYASPEQVRGEPITVASDVYSLGVVLYELLTGRRPYRIRVRTPGEVERVVCSTSPTRPSVAVAAPEEDVHLDGSADRITPEQVSEARRTHPEQLRRRLSGDLDTIVLKALAKEPERRYASAQELADDIAHHLGGKPVRARPDTRAYRMRKFVARNRYGVGAAAAIALSLVVGLVAALWQSSEAQRQRDLAVRAAHAMVFELAEGLSRMSGPTEARLGLLNQAAGVLEEIASTGSGNHAYRRQQAEAYRVLAQTYNLLGDWEVALRHATRAVRRAEALTRNSQATVADRIVYTGALLELGDALAAGGRRDTALVVFRRAVAASEPLARADVPATDADRVTSLALSRLADGLFDDTAQRHQVTAMYERAFRASERLVRADSGNAQYLGLHAQSISRLGDVMYYHRGQERESCTRYREALAVRRRAVALDSTNVSALRSLPSAMQYAAWCSESVDGDTAGAVRLYDEANGILRRMLANDPANVRIATPLVAGLAQVAQTLEERGDTAGAFVRYREAVEIGERFRNRGVSEAGLNLKIAEIASMFANALLEQNRTDEAAQVLAAERRALEALVAREPRGGLHHADYSLALAHLWDITGDTERQRGDLRRALATHREALALFKRVAEATRQPAHLQTQAFSHYKLALALKQTGDRTGARRELQGGREVLLALQRAGQLEPTSPGATRYLPKIEAELLALRD